jgi:hypothetical protein
MSELSDIIQELSKNFKVTIRPKSLDEYRNYLYEIKALCINKEIEPENIYAYHFLKEKYPYLTCKDMSDIMGLSISNYTQRKEKWIFEIKTYDDVKANINKLKDVL